MARVPASRDNSRYFAVFDYVKVRSRILSSFIGVTGTSAPDYSDAISIRRSPICRQATEVTVEYQGADGLPDCPKRLDREHQRSGLRLGSYHPLPLDLVSN
jgi:hypothetical protein